MKTRFTIAALALAATLVGCAGMMHRGGPMAMAKLEATRGNATTGMVMFHQHGEHVMVHAKVEGLKPGQEHGFHIHEKGDCSSGDGMSTGGHFNPAGKPHGPQDAEHHAGDLPSLKADAQGRADVRFHLMGVTIGSGAADIVGRGLIVHAMPDDYRTQPTGNAGGRIACAVIARHTP
ncbi:MAG: superoxide dismutase family protein [Pseudomonadota bacterium]